MRPIASLCRGGGPSGRTQAESYRSEEHTPTGGSNFNEEYDGYPDSLHGFQWNGTRRIADSQSTLFCLNPNEPAALPQGSHGLRGAHVA